MNANHSFTVFKTLVGCNSVFLPAWDVIDFDLQKELYIEQSIDSYVTAVSENNIDEWEALLHRCVQTESSDRATHQNLIKFLIKFSGSKPKLVLKLISQENDCLNRFLPAMLNGLAKSDLIADLDNRISEWINHEKYLPEIARYIQITPESDPIVLARILPLAVQLEDDFTVNEIVSAAFQRYRDTPSELIEMIFIPAVKYLFDRRNISWLSLVWHINENQSPIYALTEEQLEIVLKNLLCLPKIEAHEEHVLAILAKKHPNKIFDFFCERIAYELEVKAKNCYEAIPFQFYSLPRTFRSIEAHAINATRKLFTAGDKTFRFHGGRLLAISFPELPEGFRHCLLSYINSNRDDLEFLICTLSCYQGDSNLNEICKSIIRSLPRKDPLCDKLENILHPTGVFTGEFGMLEAYVNKKREIECWVSDSDLRIKEFAEKFIIHINNQIAAIQRSNDGNREMRRLMYERDDDINT